MVVWIYARIRFRPMCERNGQGTDCAHTRAFALEHYLNVIRSVTSGYMLVVIIYMMRVCMQLNNKPNEINIITT